MRSTGPYSRDLMTRVLEGRKQPVYPLPDEDPAPSWEEQVCGPSHIFTDASSILSKVVNAFDRTPVGWFPPRYPSPSSYPYRKLPPRQTPLTAAPLDIFGHCGYLDVDMDDDESSSESSNSTGASSVSTCSPSPSLPTRWSGKGPIPRAKKGPPRQHPLQAPREKERKKIRQRNGVKPKAKSKAKSPKIPDLRNVGTTSSSNANFEMVRCQWEDCKRWLHVDYVDVKHWGQHIREHYTDEPDLVPCRWGSGCGAEINKSSVWKHIIVHEPKFKIRCPHGCDVLTRGDMMKRHLRSCPRTSRQTTAEGDSDKENQPQGGSHGDYREYGWDSEENEWRGEN